MRYSLPKPALRKPANVSNTSEPMITRRTFLLSSSAAIALLGDWRSAWAQASRTIQVSFVLTNDIYQMSAQAMPDGKSRGGFARLAAVVKAERAKGGHVVFAHGGDTLSPSLMSGVDRGAHIIALTNLIPPDIFAPGNHEFDFGKATFLQRMSEAKFPLFAANLRAADGSQIPGFKDRAILTFDGVRIGVTGATYDDTPRTASPEDLRFAPTVATMQAASRSPAKRGRRLRRRRHACHARGCAAAAGKTRGRSDPDRALARPVRQLRRGQCHRRVRATTRTT